MRIAIGFVALLAAAAAPAQPESAEPAERPDIKQVIVEETRIPVLVEIARRAYAAKHLDVYELATLRLTGLRPYEGQFRFRLAEAYAMQDKKSESYSTLLQLQKQGLSYTMDGDPDFDNIKGTEVYAFIQDGFKANGRPKGEAEPLFTAERKDLLLEAIAYDPTRSNYLLGSVSEGIVYRADADGRLTPFITPDDENELLGIFALAVDARAGILWVATGASAAYRHIRFQDAGRTGIRKFDLGSGKFVRAYDVPPEGQPRLIGHLAASPDGGLFAADQSRIYRIEPDSDQLTGFVSSPTFTNLRGLAVDPSGERLYFSDYVLGLFGVHVAKKDAFKITQGATNLGGIESLNWYRDGLILVQDGIEPQRVVRLTLSEDGVKGVYANAILSAHPSLESPRTATVAGDRVVVIANSHLPKYDARSGEPLDPAGLKPQTLLSIDPTLNWRPPSAPAISSEQ